MSRISALALLAVFATACVRNPAPSRWLPTARTAPQDAFGAWIVLTMFDSTVQDGEFLAFDRDTVWLLRQDGNVRAEPATRIQRGQIAWYDGQYGQTAAHTALGVLSTASHGGFLILTIPMWAIAGSASAGSDSRAPLIDPAKAGWQNARIFARYPAGLPPGLPARLPVKPTGGR